MNKVCKLLVVLVCISALAVLGCSVAHNTSSNPNNSKVTTTNNKGEMKFTIPIKLTINGKTFEAVFYDYPPTQDLLKQLPLKVNLDKGSIDYCGGNLNISYKEADLVERYENGDLVFWIPGKNFVIYTNGNGQAAGKNLVPLGKLKNSVQEILKLGDSIDVTIEKQ